MSFYVSLGIVVFSALICALLQLSLGTLLLLYHSSLGRHVRKKTKALASSFIAGVCLMTFLLLATSCFLSFALLGEKTAEVSKLFFAVSAGILLALALIIWFFYYRNGKTARDSTELWLPRPISRFIDSRAKVTTNNSEAFSLGLLTVLGELPFTFVLYLLSGDVILGMSEGFEVLALSLFSLVSILSLLILRVNIRSGKTVVEIQRWRVKNKLFFKILTGICFMILAIFIFTFKLLGSGA